MTKSNYEIIGQLSAPIIGCGHNCPSSLGHQAEAPESERLGQS